jgi:hypothetical protein
MDQALLNQFFTLLEASGSFKLLSPEQQATVKASYQNATDEQLHQAFQALEQDKTVIAQIEADALKGKEEAVKGATELKTVMKEVKHDEMVEAEAADNANSQQEMQNIEQELGVSAPKKEEPKKRKKFLGLF